MWGCRQEATNGESVNLSWEEIETVQNICKQAGYMLQCWEKDTELQAQLMLETWTNKSTEVTKATAECLSLYEKVQGSSEEVQKMVDVVRKMVEDQKDEGITVREAGITKREAELTRREHTLREDMQWQRQLLIDAKRNETCVRKDSGASMARTRLCNLGQVYV